MSDIKEKITVDDLKKYNLEVTNLPVREWETWTAKLEIKTYDEINDESYFEKLLKWICYTFKKHFVVIMKTEEIVAGGCVDNTFSYQNRQFKTYRLIVNCHEPDAVLFKMMFQ